MNSLTEQFVLRVASIPGRYHLRKNMNNQDALSLGHTIVDGEEFLFGAVCDGCTGKPKTCHTEVGSSLLALFIKSELALLLASHIPLADIPHCLYSRCIGFFRSIAGATVYGGPQPMWEFIESYLLCTVVGFIMSSKTLVTFSAGDGVVVIDDSISIIDEEDRPRYLAYHLVDRAILGDVAETLPISFETKAYSVSSLRRAAICTDGMKHVVSEKDKCDSLWAYEPKAKAGLQWRLNVLANEEPQLFKDDATIITIERRMACE